MVDYNGNCAPPRLDLMEALEEHAFDFKGIGTQILPICEVDREQASFSAFPRANQLQRADVNAAERGNYNEVTTAAKDKSYKTVERGLIGRVFDRERVKFEMDFDLDYQTSKTVLRVLQQEQELRVKTAVFNEATFAATFKDVSATDPWDDPDADVITAIQDRMEASRTLTGEEPNTLILGKKPLLKLLRNNDIIRHFPGNPGPISRKMLQDSLALIFGLDEMLVGTEVFNASSEGDIANISDIWGENYVAVAKIVPEGSSIKVSGLGRTYAWTRNGGVLQVETYREEPRRSDVHRVRQDVDERVQDSAYLGLLKIKA